MEIKFLAYGGTDQLIFKQRSMALTANYQSRWRNGKGSKENQDRLAVNSKLFEADKFHT